MEDMINAAEEPIVWINERCPTPAICLLCYWVVLFQRLICYCSKRLFPWGDLKRLVVSHRQLADKHLCECLGHFVET